EDTILEALELAHSEIIKLCEAQEDLRRQAGKPKWLDLELSKELESQHGHTIWERIQSVGLKDAGAVVEELVGELAPPLSMDSTDEDITRQMQVRSSLLALTDAEQDSKQLKSAKRHLLFEHIAETVELSFPVGPAVIDPETGEAKP